MLEVGTDERRSKTTSLSPPTTAVERAILDREEIFNVITHGLGIAFSVAGVAVLGSYVFSNGNAWQIIGCGMYGATLISVYTASTLSHWVVHPEWRSFFRKLDQSLIYLLIAGSYTPFALLYLRFSWWWLLLALMWGLALWGFASKMFIPGQKELVLLRRYLILGWLPIIPAFKYVDYVPFGALAWVLAGGLYYSVGTIFLFLNRKNYYFHAIWHTFVMAGSACHFFGVLIYVALAPQA